MSASPPSEFAIEVTGLVKRYPKSQTNAVNGISFAVRRGEIFGLLGPNGAGKTTTIGILTTSVTPTAGSARITSLDVATDPIGVKQRIAVVPQTNNLDRSLRVREILTFHAAYHGVSRSERRARADTLLTELGLFDRRNDKVARYSGGMVQRLMIARALMHSPDILFLDEPTNNLDPQSRLFLWDRIRALNASGLTILLTTHDMEEADQLCGRIAIMDYGKILVNDTGAELKKLIPGASSLELRVRVPEPAVVGAGDGAATPTGRVLETLRTLPGVEEVDELKKTAAAPIPAAGGPWNGGGGRTGGTGGAGGAGGAGGGPGGPGAWMPQGQAAEQEEEGVATFRVYSQDAGALVGPVSHALASIGVELRDLHVKRPSLEDVFIHLTGRNLR